MPEHVYARASFDYDGSVLLLKKCPLAILNDFSRTFHTPYISLNNSISGRPAHFCERPPYVIVGSVDHKSNCLALFFNTDAIPPVSLRTLVWEKVKKNEEKMTKMKKIKKKK
jgi:hypothetical protein